MNVTKEKELIYEKKVNALKECDEFIKEVTNFSNRTKEELLEVRKSYKNIEYIDMNNPPGPGLILTEEEMNLLTRKALNFYNEFSQNFSNPTRRLMTCVIEFCGKFWKRIDYIYFNLNGKKIKLMKMKDEVISFESLLYELYNSIDVEIRSTINDNSPKFHYSDSIDLLELKVGRDISILNKLELLLENSVSDKLIVMAMGMPFTGKNYVVLQKTTMYVYKINDEDKDKIKSKNIFFTATLKDESRDYGWVRNEGVYPNDSAKNFIGWVFTAPNRQIEFIDPFWTTVW